MILVQWSSPYFTILFSGYILHSEVNHSYMHKVNPDPCYEQWYNALLAVQLVKGGLSQDAKGHRNHEYTFSSHFPAEAKLSSLIA